jgi:hypothetical protein
VTLDRDCYLEAIADYNANWRVIDEALYGVCQKRPRHDNFAGVVKKVYIIGRSYTTQVVSR